MHVLQVGQPYNPRRQRWPETTVLRLLRPATAELVLFYDSPTPQEVSAVRSQPAKFGWYDAGWTGVLSYEFVPDLPLSAAPYTPHREDRAAGEPGIGQDVVTLPLRVVLVDAGTGIVRALRQVVWPTGFVNAVRSTVTQLAARPAAQPDEDLPALLDRVLTTTAGTVQAMATCQSHPDHADQADPPDPAPAPTAASTPQQLVAAWAGGQAVPGRSYPAPLPADLTPWYFYTAEGGHSVLVALKTSYWPGSNPDDFLVGAPVKAVQRTGWEISEDGFVVADLPYDKELGLLASPDDEEF